MLGSLWTHARLLNNFSSQTISNLHDSALKISCIYKYNSNFVGNDIHFLGFLKISLLYIHTIL